MVIVPVVISDHAKRQLKRRNINEKRVISVVNNPDKITSSFRERKLRRRRVGSKILEVVARTEGSTITVITGYYLKE